jgi:MFS family permease
MGRYSDQFGRKRALKASVVLMCFGSLVIAFCPGVTASLHKVGDVLRWVPFTFKLLELWWLIPRRHP